MQEKQEILICDERWEWVIGYVGEFEISNIGNVRSYKKYGHNNRLKEPKPIKPCKDGRGYFNFTARLNGKPKVLLIHIELAKAFIPNPNNYKLVRHLNDIKADNRQINLAWGTHKDNREDGIKNGKHFHEIGKRPVVAKLNPKLVEFIFNAPYTAQSLSSKFYVSVSTIHKIRQGRNWNRITGLPYKK